MKGNRGLFDLLSVELADLGNRWPAKPQAAGAPNKRLPILGVARLSGVGAMDGSQTAGGA